MDNTVDGRNPAPVDSKFMPLFTGFCTSQVVQDFFHSQHHIITLIYFVLIQHRSKSIQVLRFYATGNLIKSTKFGV